MYNIFFISLQLNWISLSYPNVWSCAQRFGPLTLGSLQMHINWSEKTSNNVILPRSPGCTHPNKQLSDQFSLCRVAVLQFYLLYLLCMELPDQHGRGSYIMLYLHCSISLIVKTRERNLDFLKYGSDFRCPCTTSNWDVYDVAPHHVIYLLETSNSFWCVE